LNRFIILVATLLVAVLASCEQEQTEASRLQEVFPSVEIRNAALFRVNQTALTQAFFKGQWTLVSFSEAGCSQQCLHRLELLAAADDVQRLFFLQGMPDHVLLSSLANKFPSIAITMGATAISSDIFYGQFDVDFIEAQQKQEFIYLINSNAELEYVLPQEQVKSGILNVELDRLTKN